MPRRPIAGAENFWCEAVFLPYAVRPSLNVARMIRYGLS